MSVFLRRLRDLHRDDRGTSLAELVVGMTVMGIFMTIFTAAVVSMARTTTKVEAVTTAAAQVNHAFLTLDKTVRYATAITTVGLGDSTTMVGGKPRQDIYVELSGNDPYDSHTATCTQLRVHFDPAEANQSLQLRSWPAAAGPPTTWTTLATNVTNGALFDDADPPVDQPFLAPEEPPGVVNVFERLAVTLVTDTSDLTSTSKTRTRIAFTALNSSVANPTDAKRCKLSRP